MSLSLVTPADARLPDVRPTQYRYWARYTREQLKQIRARIQTVLDDMERQFDLFSTPAPQHAPIALAQSSANPATVEGLATARTNDMGAMLSPSQVKMFLFTCSSRWWFRYGAGLPDPPSGSLVRGRVVHKMAELYFRAKIAGAAIAPDDLAEPFELAWDEEADKARFHSSEKPAELKNQAAVLTRKYLDEVAPEIEPAAVEQSVSGTIGGVPVRGILDVIDTDGRIVDLKTAARSPSGIDPSYALQLATYRQLAPGANGKVRLDTMVATKKPQLVTLAHEVTVAAQVMTHYLYPHVREGIREGLYFPNRMSNLCSRRTCNFWKECEGEYGGTVKGNAE